MSQAIYSNVSGLSRGYLARPRLDALFEEHIHNSLITVVAGAGYGKTQAVSAFLRNKQLPTIWLQLSSLDNLYSRLWDRFADSIAPHDENLAQKLGGLKFPDSLVTFDIFLRLLSTELLKKEKYYIVLDDFHLINEQSVLVFIEKLAEAQVKNLTLILLSRTSPDINTIGLLSKGLLSRITEEDLRFTPYEVEAYLNLHRIHVSADTIAELCTYTDGWIFALYLLQLSMRGHEKEIPKITSFKLDIFKLIENEIFHKISPSLQKFLLKMARIDLIPHGLLTELAENNSAIIQEMMSISSFIRFNNFSNLYRMQHLFQDFLREKQSLLEEEDIRRVHAVAAKWYADNNYLTDAVMHYLEIHDYDKMLQVILRPAPRVSHQTADNLIQILSGLPEFYYQQQPFVGIMRIKYLLNNFRHVEAKEECEQLLFRYREQEDTPENKKIIGELYLVLALAYMMTSTLHSTWEFAQYFQLADAYLQHGSALFDNSCWLTANSYTVPLGRTFSHELGRIEQMMRDTVPYISRVMNGCGYGLYELNVTEKSFFTRDFTTAEKFARQAIVKSQQKGQYDIACLAIFYLMRIGIALGHYDSIMALFEQLKNFENKNTFSEYYASADIIQGWFYASIGYTKKVSEWIKHERQGWNADTPITFGFDFLVHVKVYLAEKKYHEALALLERPNDTISLDVFLIGSIELKVLRSIALYRVQEREKALDTFTEAYELAKANGLIMPFIEGGNDMRTLTRAMSHSGRTSIPTEWLQNIQTKSSTYAKKHACVVSAYEQATGLRVQQGIGLTKREVSILSDLCQGLTREEIADNCSLSINSVKSILQSIFTKLRVSNTLEAVRVATQLGLWE